MEGLFFVQTNDSCARLGFLLLPGLRVGYRWEVGTWALPLCPCYLSSQNTLNTLLPGTVPLSARGEPARSTDHGEMGRSACLFFSSRRVSRQHITNGTFPVTCSFYKEERVIMKISQQEDVFIPPFQPCYP